MIFQSSASRIIVPTSDSGMSDCLPAGDRSPTPVPPGRTLSRKFTRACLCCGRSGVPIGLLYTLCRPCWDIPANRCERYRTHLSEPEVACPYPPGTPEKVAWMQARVADGFSPCSPLDSDFEGHGAGCLQPRLAAEVFSLPSLRIRGVERTEYGWRARPAWEHERHYLGVFRTRKEAEAVVRRFWIDEMGLFFELGGAMRYYLLSILAAKLGSLDADESALGSAWPARKLWRVGRFNRKRPPKGKTACEAMTSLFDAQVDEPS